MPSDYARSLLKINIDGQPLFDEGDFTVNLPDEWQTPSGTKTSGGRTLGRNLFPDANEVTVDLTVAQGTPTSGRLLKLLEQTHRGVRSAVDVSYYDDSHLGDGAESGVDSPNVAVFGGTFTHSDERGEVNFTLHCIGFTISRKNADPIISSDQRDPSG